MKEVLINSVIRCLFYVAGIVCFIFVTIASTHYVDDYYYTHKANEFKLELLQKEDKVIEIGDSIIKANGLNTKEYNDAFKDMDNLILTQL